MMHENGCDELSNTQDWIPLSEFTEEALVEVDLRHCPACLDQPVSEVVDAAKKPAPVSPME